MTRFDYASSIAHSDKLFIGGSWRDPSSSSTFATMDPTTEEPLLSFARANAADMDAAISIARDAFDNGGWPRLSHEARANYLRELSAELERRIAPLSGIWSSEVGSVYAINLNIVPHLAATYRYYAELAKDFAFVEPHAAQRGYLVREPVGVVAAIIPWNAPLMLTGWKLAPALLAGCTAIVKAPSEAPGMLYLLAEAAEAIGLPKGVLSVLTCDRTVAERLVQDPRIDKVSFTGSTSAGQRIASLCGARVARCTLELGGKSPAIVLDDSDISAVAQTLGSSIRMLTGQVCATLSRIIVSRSRQAELAEAIGAVLRETRVGDPFDSSTQMGPLASAPQLRTVETYIDQAVQAGTRLVTGGRRPASLDRGYFIEPTLFMDVDNRSPLAREEIFGPVLSMIPYDSQEEAISIANDSPYGLNAAVFTANPDRAFEIARELRCGNIAHNAFRTDFSIAFGGFKQSGIGREGGRDGLLAYTEAKTILVEPSWAAT